MSTILVNEYARCTIILNPETVGAHMPSLTSPRFAYASLSIREARRAKIAANVAKGLLDDFEVMV